jgi:energy-coupling factor transporter transmembrane protein EcfT
MTVAAVLVFLQSVFAGGLIAESVASEEAHRLNGMTLGLVFVIVLVTSVFVRWPGRGPVWPLASSAVFIVLVMVQAVLGFAEVVQFHVPLGVLITIGAVTNAVSAWKLVRERSRLSR